MFVLFVPKWLHITEVAKIFGFKEWSSIDIVALVAFIKGLLKIRVPNAS